jgi:hypothetical protein
MVKIFTIVKDEDDIISEWIIYHGYLFGYENLHIIDNMSTDGTYEKIVSFKNKGINIYRKHDYSKKGKYMTELMKQHCSNNEFAFPIDIDEFIVYYDKSSDNSISTNKEKISNYLKSLPVDNKIFKMNFIFTNNHIDNNFGFDKAFKKCLYGSYRDFKEIAKTFVNSSLFTNETIDHGNHYSTNDYILTNLCLVHYHFRNLEQFKKKVYNNVLGFNYPTDLDGLKKLNPRCSGCHHVNNLISMLENTYKVEYSSHCEGNNDISLKELSEFGEANC